MVNLEDVPGLDISLLVDGVPLKEYEDSEEVKIDRAATRYVEVQSEQHFGVSIRFDEPFVRRAKDVQCTLRMDGQGISGWVQSLEGPTPVQKTKAYVRRERDGQTYKQHFVFSQLNLSEDHDKLDSGLVGRLAALGSISLEIDDVKSVKRSPWRGAPESSIVERSYGSNPVPEKALKGRAVSHAVSFFETVTSRNPKQARHATIKPQADGLPLAKVTFKYQSLAALKASGILPRTPQNEENPGDDGGDDLDGLSADELRARLRDHMKTSSQHPRLKQEPTEEPSALLAVPDDSVIPLGQPMARKRSFSEIIDLTDD